MQTLSEGSSLQHGTYRIERVLGQGGFGITYLATDLNLDRKVVIKEFFPKDYCDRDKATSQVTLGTSNTAELVKRLKTKFLKEARNIARFDHPNIIRIFSAFEENNTAYYVMEYIEGESLSEMVKRNGPLTEKRALAYIEKVGGALEYVHARKINHLDVKPANIMVRRSDDRPILIDFGLSKQYDSEGNQTSTMAPGFSHGYAPMEQYNEGGVKGFSPQTDLYSLAATLYYLLSGVRPPQATRLIEEQLTFPSDIPAYLVGPISKAMSSARPNRHESIGKFLKEIDSCSDPDTVILPKPTPAIHDRRVYTSAQDDYNSARAHSPVATDDEVEYDEEPKSNNRWYLIGGAIAVIIFFAFFLLKDSSDPSAGISDTLPDSVKVIENLLYQSSLGPCSYTGEVDSDGKPHGKGKAEWERGLGKTYDGQWIHGEMDGECIYLNRDGYQFIGKFKAGHYSEGKLISPDKSYYEGTYDKKGDKWTGTEYDSRGNKTETWVNGE